MAESLLGRKGPLDNEGAPDNPSIVFAASPPPRLEFRKLDRTSRSLLYQSLQYLALNADATKMIIVFDDCKVEVLGKNLQSLYDAVNQHRVGCIIEVDKATPGLSPETPLVETCTLDLGDNAAEDGSESGPR
jgi:hypothetical protein